MSVASERLKKNRTKIVKAFIDAIDPPQQSTCSKPLPTPITFCLLGTMLPFQAAVVFFSMSTASIQADSTIKTIHGTQIDRGYGLISVTIAGKS